MRVDDGRCSYKMVTTLDLARSLAVVVVAVEIFIVSLPLIRLCITL